MKDKKSFSEWIKDQSERNDEIGSLAKQLLFSTLSITDETTIEEIAQVYDGEMYTIVCAKKEYQDDEVVSIKKKTRSKRKTISVTLRFEILKKYGYCCRLCGKSAKDGAKLEVDHIVPISKGGTNTEINLQVLCSVCNNGKRNKSV